MSSSLLNVSNDASSRSEELSVKDINVFVDNEEQNWLKRTHVGKFLLLEDIRTSLNGLEKCEMLTRQELVPTQSGTLGWYGPKTSKTRRINSSQSLGS